MLTIIIAAIVVAVDQITKFFILRDVLPVIDIPIWDGVLHFHYAQNTGAAFGILSGYKWVFLTIACIFVVGTFIFVLIKRKSIDTMALITLGLITGGALGNIIDRFRFGYVVDFIYVKIINFAIFNIADSCIVVGTVLLGIYILFIYKEPNKEIEQIAKDKND